MDDKILLQELIKKTLLSQEAADKVLREAFLLKKSAEDLIYERRLVDEAEVAKIKSAVLGVPFKKIDIAAVTPELLKYIPAETSRTYSIAPLEKRDDMLVVGMLRPDNVKAQDALKFIAKQLKVNLGVYLIVPSDLERVWRKYSPFKSEVEESIKLLKARPGGEGAAFQRIIQLEEGATVAEEAPIIRIVSATLREAVEQGASDIHIEPQRSRLRIRFRMEGDLHEVSSMPLELHQPIVSRVKVLSNLKIDETRVPQDGRFRTIVFGRDIDFRVATFPTPMGEKAAIRVLDPTIGLRDVKDLGITGRNWEIIKEGLDRPFGMILLTGPTGSGKTTTLYSFLQILNKEDVNIVSLEDPVEYFVDGLNQSQVKPEIGYDFASGLRQILRQDPDVIMVGEVRDSETAALAVHAALTGHVVLSTLHTNNAIGVIPRLIDMKVEPFLLPSSLNLMLAQRLITKICQNCKKKEAASADIQAAVKKSLNAFLPEAREKLPFKEPYEIYHAAGCASCRFKGTSGRVALYEALRMTPELQEIISSGSTEAKLFAEAKRQGMITLRQDGVIKALEGLVFAEEVLRETTEM
ncbi:MAG: GspE/PulE family protein [Patescibacteria group bacterium]